MFKRGFIKLAAISILAAMGSCGSAEKTGYIELNVLFEKFPLKKELESQLDIVRNRRKAILDSMGLIVHRLGTEAQLQNTPAIVQTFHQERQALAEKQQTFEVDNARIAQEYNQQIWKQINQYVKDFGQEESYVYILGAEGSGSVMYADKSKNITEEVSQYINNKYRGGAKK